MDLSALLEYHSVMSICKMTMDDDVEELFTVSSPPAVVIHASNEYTFCLPFCIDTKPSISGNAMIFANFVFTFSNSKTLSFYLGLVKANQPSGATTYVLSSNARSVDDSDYSSEATYNIGQTYVMIIRMKYESTVNYIGEVAVYSLNEFDVPIVVVNSYSEAHVSAMSSATLLNIVVYPLYSSTYVSNCRLRLYEPHFCGVIGDEATSVADVFDHMVFGAERSLIITYDEPDVLFRNYLLPPKSAFYGSIYDQTDVLNELIEAQDIEIAALTTDLESLQTSLDVKLTAPRLAIFDALGTFDPQDIADFFTKWGAWYAELDLDDAGHLLYDLFYTLGVWDYATYHAIYPEGNGFTFNYSLINSVLEDAINETFDYLEAFIDG